MTNAGKKYNTKLQLIAFSFFLLCTLTVTANDGQNIIRPKIQSIANKLQKDNIVHFGYAVGYAPKPETNNKYFKLYKRLKSKATNQELVELTNSRSEIIVVYAFNILSSRNYEGLKNVFFNHVNDTTWFWTAGGCTGLVDRIYWFMLRRLKPAVGDSSRNLLTKNEYDLYCNRFKLEDRMFTCE